MSENENESPAPSKQTSSVPLKKETVRVTLKAADAPPAAPSGGPPTAPAVRPPTPSAPSAPAAGGAPRPPAPAPTIPLRSAGTVPAPAPTIKLATSTAPIRPGGSPTSTGGPGLPKATVPLSAPTQPLTSRPPVPVSTLRMDDEEEEEEGGSGIATALSVVGFIAALVVLIAQIMIANSWTEGQLGRIFE